MQLRKHELTRSIDKHEPPSRFPELAVHERIKLRAFEIYKGRGGFPGSALIDWLRAEWECQADESGSMHRRN